MDTTMVQDVKGNEYVLEEPKRVVARVLPDDTTKAGHPGAPIGPTDGPVAPTLPESNARKPRAHRRRKWLLITAAVAGLAIGGYAVAPSVNTALNTVSTDDAYVNGHVTLVAPRVAGHVAKVLVDDNQRVKKGDVLVQLDKEPYEVQVEIKRATVVSAEADLAAANAQVRGVVAQIRANRFLLQHAMEDVKTQTADLSAAVAALTRDKASLTLAKANLARGEVAAPTGAMSKEDLDQRRQMVKVDEATIDLDLQKVYALRAGLGLPAEPPPGTALGDVPAKLEQNVSAVQQDLGTLLQSAAQLGYYPATADSTPEQVIENFYKQDPQGNLDRILARLMADAPAVKQAEAKLLQARRELKQGELNLRYCDVVSDIDGVVTGRNVNPGSDVQQGQDLLAVRSVKEIWIDANFKETQLGDLRIGQHVRCEVDMYGNRREFDGRITGFTMGTGQTLALLPPQNATGNFVKIVQRLPVRVELTDYDPEKNPLFVGLSVTPYVYYKEAPVGPHAGDVLQSLATLPTASSNP